MSDRSAYAARLVALVGVAALVVLATVAGGTLLAPGGSVSPDAAYEEYDPATLAPERIEAQGQPQPQGDVGTVVIDEAHTNRFDREDIAGLTKAITQAGGDLEFLGVTDDLATRLEGADVFVVVDPGTGYTSEEVAAVESFVADGGRLVVFGEPNRRSVQSSGLTAVLTTERSQLTELASAFGVSFGTQYLYDVRTNDGNFKDVLASPNVDGALVEGVETVALSTAAPVYVNRGRVVLRTPATTSLAGRSTDRGFPVAVTTNDGRVLAVGDTSMLTSERVAIGDNDVLVARIVEFMAEA